MKYPKPKKGLTYSVFCKNIVDIKDILWWRVFSQKKT